jgi:hypothetical protein
VPHPEPWAVVGRVSADAVRITAWRRGRSNSWRRQLRADLLPDGPGCRLVGRLRGALFVQVFSALWLAGVLAMVPTTIGLAVRHLAESGPAVLLVPLVPLAMGAFFVLLTTLAVRGRRGEEEYLLGWLRQTLECPQRVDTVR